MTEISWAGSSASGTGGTNTIDANNVLAIADAGLGQNPRRIFPLRMSGGQRVDVVFEARCFSGRIFAFADAVEGNVTELIATRVVDVSREWRQYVMTVTVPLKYGDNTLINIGFGGFTNEAGSGEFRAPSFRSDNAAEVVSTCAQNGLIRHPTAGLLLKVDGQDVAQFTADMTLPSMDDVIGAIDAYMSDTLDPDAAAYIARMVPAPVAGVQTVINDFVLALKAESGLWGSIGAAFIGWQSSAYNSRIDLKNPDHRASFTGNVRHDPYLGWTGDGVSTSYINSGYLLTGVPGYSQNDAHMVVYCETDQSSANGAVGSLTTNGSANVVPRNGSNMTVRGNCGALSRAVASAIGFSGWTRRNSSTVHSIRDGATQSHSATSTTPPDTNLVGLRAGSGALAGRISYFGAGSQHSDAQALAYFNAVDDLRTAMMAFA